MCRTHAWHSGQKKVRCTNCCLTHTRAPQTVDELKSLHLPWRPKQTDGTRVEQLQELADFFLQHRHLYGLRQ
jgi:hypothetical protein